MVMDRRELLKLTSGALLGWRGSLARAASGGRSPKVLYFTRSAGFEHSVVKRQNGQLAHSEKCLIDMGKRDVLVIFDIRRYQESLVRFAEKAHHRGVQIILFTDQWLSPIARFARHVISARTGVPSNWDSNAAILAIIEALMAAATKTLWDLSKARMEALEILRKNSQRPV